MEFNPQGLEEALEAAEDSDFPGRKTGCALGYTDLEGRERFVTGTNDIFIYKGGDLWDKYIRPVKKPYEWALHAELAAIASAAGSQLDLNGVAYLTGSPCLQCAIALFNAGIQLIVISKDDPFKKNEYHIKEAFEFLEDYDVTVVREV